MSNNLSFVRYTADGTTSSFALTVGGADIGYFKTTDIHAYVDGAPVASTINPQTPHIVTLLSTPPSGSSVLIRREVPFESPYADFSRGNNFGQRQLNNSFLQQLYLTQQILDGFLPDGFYFKGDVSFGGNRITAVGDAKVDTDAVNKKQLEQFTEDLSVVGGSTISEEPPELKVRGQRWTNCSTMIPYIWTGNEWVQDVPTIGGTSILVSPDGGKWLLSVDNIGSLYTTKL